MGTMVCIILYSSSIMHSIQYGYDEYAYYELVYSYLA